MKQLAAALVEGTYQSQYLLNSYKPVPSNKVLEKSLKLFNGYSRYENMTGVYLEQGENVVLVGDLHGRQISLLIPEWTRQPTPGFEPTKDPEGWGLKNQEIPLHEGVNVIYVHKPGNVYLNYFADLFPSIPLYTFLRLQIRSPTILPLLQVQACNHFLFATKHHCTNLRNHTINSKTLRFTQNEFKSVSQNIFPGN